jgi:tetratricopeptide (TPR) repeat protein
MNFFRERRDAEALRIFDEVLADDAGNERAIMGRCLALGRLGRAEEALQIVEGLLRENPRHARAYDIRASLHEYRGDFEQAHADFERSIVLEPDGSEHHYNFACYWAARGDAEQCRKHLAEAIRLDPPSHVYAATDVDLERTGRRSGSRIWWRSSNKGGRRLGTFFSSGPLNMIYCFKRKEVPR